MVTTKLEIFNYIWAINFSLTLFTTRSGLDHRHMSLRKLNPLMCFTSEFTNFIAYWAFCACITLTHHHKFHSLINNSRRGVLFGLYGKTQNTTTSSLAVHQVHDYFSTNCQQAFRKLSCYQKSTNTSQFTQMWSGIKLLFCFQHELSIIILSFLLSNVQAVTHSIIIKVHRLRQLNC